MVELEKTAKLRLEKELILIDNFAKDSLEKVKTFCDSLKQEINAFLSEYQQKVQKSSENYKNFLMNESNLLESMKSYSKNGISELELSNFKFSMTNFSLYKLLSENISFDIGLQTGFVKNEACSSLALIYADASPSLESPYRQRSRTRVSTKIHKKVLPMNLYSPNEGSLMIYNIPSGEVTQIEGKIDSLSICTATADGSIIITGGLNNSSTFIYNILEKTLEKTENMIISRFNHAGVFLGDFVYVIGGRNESILNNCERFDLIEKS